MPVVEKEGSDGANDVGDSFVGPNLVLEGTITGEGNLRVAGHLKGKLTVEGDVTIEPGAFVDGEVKAASVTVAPGAHMRGTVEFGWARSASEERGPANCEGPNLN